MIEEQKIAEKKIRCYLFCVFHGAHESESKTSIQQRKTTKKKLNIVEEQKSAEKKKSCNFFVFFTVLMDLRAKHSSNREKLQRKIVKYSKRTKNRKEEKSCYLSCVLHGAHESESKTFIQHTKSRLIWQKNTKIGEKNKSLTQNQREEQKLNTKSKRRTKSM